MERERQMEVFFSSKNSMEYQTFWVFALSKEEIFSETPGGLWFCPLAMYS